MSVHPFPMRKASAADLAEDQAKFAGCVIALLEPDEAPMDDVMSCDLCHATEYDICAIPGQHGPDHLCINCVSDYAAYPIVQTGTRLAEPQLQRVQRDIDRFPTIPANNSYGPHTAEDWGDWRGVAPMIPLGVVAAAMTVAAGVLAVMSWLTGWPL